MKKDSKPTLAGAQSSSPTVSILAEGQLIAGRYRIKEKIGAGGMGVVYRVEDEELDNRPFAFKALPPDIASSKAALTRLRKEAQAAIGLHHPNIMALHSYVSEGNDGYLIMELLSGQDLECILAEHEKLELNEVLDIACQVSEALDYAHKLGVVHRDIKPANLIYTEVAGERVIKIADFGIAYEIRTSVAKITGNDASSGTLCYMPPEQMAGRKTDAKGDQYSMAATLYELLDGQPPFLGGGVTLMNLIETREPDPIKGLPEHVNAAILKALSKKPEDRFDSCIELYEALKGQGVTAIRKPHSSTFSYKPLLAIPLFILFTFLMHAGKVALLYLSEIRSIVKDYERIEQSKNRPNGTERATPTGPSKQPVPTSMPTSQYSLVQTNPASNSSKEKWVVKPSGPILFQTSTPGIPKIDFLEGPIAEVRLYSSNEIPGERSSNNTLVDLQYIRTNFKIVKKHAMTIRSLMKPREFSIPSSDLMNFRRNRSRGRLRKKVDGYERFAAGDARGARGYFFARVLSYTEAPGYLSDLGRDYFAYGYVCAFLEPPNFTWVVKACDETLSIFEHQKGLNPKLVTSSDFAWVHHLKAWALFKQGKLEAALQENAFALEKSPENNLFKENYVANCLIMKQFKQAWEKITQYSKKFMSANLAIYGARAQIARGDFYSADGWLRLFIDNADLFSTVDKSRLLVERAQVQLCQNNRERAKRLISSALELNPKLASAYFVRAKLLSREGNFGEATRALEEASKLEPQSTVHRFNLVKLYLHNIRNNDAIRELKTILDLSKNDTEKQSEALLTLGKCYVSTNNIGLAREQLVKLRTIGDDDKVRLLVRLVDR